MNWPRALESELHNVLGGNDPVRSRVTNVYAIGIPGRFVKIGVAKNPEGRLKDLQVGNPYDLRLLGHLRGPAGWEPFIHTKLASSRLRGEWFAWTDEVDGLIDALNGMAA